MKSAGKYCKSLNRARLLLLIAMIVRLGVRGLAFAAASTEETQLMFVQIADDLKVDPAKKTLRLVRGNQQTLFFSDRPQRIPGHLKMSVYLETWKKGRDSFRKVPPNATLSVYEPGHDENTLAVVELTNPVVDGADLVYNYRLINGKLPAGGGASALFIDWFGVGGRVGAGFHGVGAGARGWGVRPGYGFGGPGVGGPRGIGW
jgi:hypothetical protein